MTSEKEKADHPPTLEMSGISFMESERGGKLLIYKNFVYRIVRKTMKNSHWKCRRNNSCKARLILTGKTIVKMSGEHFHEDDSRIIEKRRFCSRLKDKVRKEPYTGVPKIYREELAAVATSNGKPFDTPRYTSIKNTLYKERYKSRPSLLNAEEMVPPDDELEETVNAEIPLHVEDEDKRNVEDGDKKSYIDLDSPDEMAGNVESTRIPLKSTCKSIHSNVYTLKIPNFYTLPEAALRTKCKNNNTNRRYVIVDSQDFEFAAATWRFTFHTDLYSAKVYKAFSIDLERLKYEVPRQRVFYTITLLDANGEKYTESSDVQLFDKKGKNFNLSSFENRKPSYDKRDRLTLSIHLMCDEPPDQDSLPIDKYIQALMCDRSAEEVADQDSLTIDKFNHASECDKSTGKDSDQDSLTMDRCKHASECDKSTGEDADQNSLTIHNCKQALVCDKPAEEDADQDSLTMDTCEQTLMRDKPAGVDADQDSLTIDKCKQASMCDKPAEEDADQVSPTLDKCKQASMCDKPAGEDADQDTLTIDRDAYSLSNDFKKLLTNGKNYDLTLTVGDRRFRVHRDIMLARSDVFEVMHSQDLIEKHSGIINVEDCDPQALEQFLSYVYSGKVDTLNEENMLGLYYAADKYNVTLLKEKCSDFIKKSLSTSNICDVIQFALSHRYTDLFECATGYFVNHTAAILQTEGWKSFMRLNSDKANELLLEAAKTWTDK